MMSDVSVSYVYEILKCGNMKYMYQFLTLNSFRILIRDINYVDSLSRIFLEATRWDTIVFKIHAWKLDSTFFRLPISTRAAISAHSTTYFRIAASVFLGEALRLRNRNREISRSDVRPEFSDLNLPIANCRERSLSCLLQQP